MIAAAIIQSAYNELYRNVRNYIWDYNTVEKLAELEAATYMAFPDLDKVRICSAKLKEELVRSDVYDDDEELQSAMEAFDKNLEGADSVFYGVTVPQEITEKQRDLEELVEERRENKPVREEVFDENTEVITENREDNTEAEL
ncbi:hypothetical protein [Ruminococcus sp.]|uniref:hypothetical protein n=1 Tax=Ruminococcus sp. TaxID=41978 RepID=UPI001B5A72F7|nr:hypothetical protein [Ruminococcus sp.]MBP5433588.1 hypothetical protein [Ruminococcus sp.]